MRRSSDLEAAGRRTHHRGTRSCRGTPGLHTGARCPAIDGMSMSSSMDYSMSCPTKCSIGCPTECAGARCPPTGDRACRARVRARSVTGATRPSRCRTVLSPATFESPLGTARLAPRAPVSNVGPAPLNDQRQLLGPRCETWAPVLNAVCASPPELSTELHGAKGTAIALSRLRVVK